MTFKTLSILLICIILTPLTSFPNGGPVDISHFRKTGNIRLLRKADISLLKENLNIRVIGDYTEIEVDYLVSVHKLNKSLTTKFTKFYTKTTKF